MTGSRCPISSAYERKHNEANGENNNDGESHNLSMNFGVEGVTTDPAILDARTRQVRSFFATLFLSQGVPMMLAGDEIGRTQAGNNNAYCQDNALSWVSWNLTPHSNLCSISSVRSSPIGMRIRILRRRHFFEGRRLMAGCEKDLTWFDPNGEEMTSASWGDPERHTLGMRLFGLELDEPDVRGVPFAEEVLFAMFHASDTAGDVRAAGVFSGRALGAAARHGGSAATARPERGTASTVDRRRTPCRDEAWCFCARSDRPRPHAAVTASRGRGRPRRRSSDYRSQ